MQNDFTSSDCDYYMIPDCHCSSFQAVGEEKNHNSHELCTSCVKLRQISHPSPPNPSCSQKELLNLTTIFVPNILHARKSSASYKFRRRLQKNQRPNASFLFCLFNLLIAFPTTSAAALSRVTPDYLGTSGSEYPYPAAGSGTSDYKPPPSSPYLNFGELMPASGFSSSECDYSICTKSYENFTRSINQRVVIEQCVIFSNWISCLKKHGSGCYSDLTFNGIKAFTQKNYDENNCQQVLDMEDKDKKKEVEKKINDQINAVGQTDDNLCFITQQEENVKSARPVSLASPPVLCSLFGDPHLVTFGGRMQTCATIGAWPMVDNKYFTIQALNVPLPKSSEPGAGSTDSSTSKSSTQAQDQSNSDAPPPSPLYATETDSGLTSSGQQPSAITKVMVFFRAKEYCTQERVYDSTSGALPSAFNDGSFSGGHYDNLKVVQVANGSHVELRAPYINTTVIIRRVGLYLSVTVTSPLDVVKSLPPFGHSEDDFHLELCSAGCPDTETLAEFPQTPPPPPSPAISPQKVTYSEAKKLCQHLSGFFFDSCVFDVVTTGDSSTFVQIGLKSSQDLSRLKSRSTSQDLSQYFPRPLSYSLSTKNDKSVSSLNTLSWLLVFLIFLFQLKCSVL